MVSYHLAMFGGHLSSAMGDMKYLLSHVTSQNHANKESDKFMCGSSSLHVTTLPSLVAVGIVVVELKCF